MAESEAGQLKKLVTSGLESILQRIAEFFDIFDLSFLLSGAVVLGALQFWLWRIDISLPPAFTGFVFYAALVIAAYIAGLLCFCLGRWIRLRWRSERFKGGAADRFLPILKGHGLDAAPGFAEYLARNASGGEEKLYVRLWAELRDCPDLAASHALLRRYWVMAATCDGMVVALIVWIFVLAACAFGLGGAQQIDKCAAGTSILGLALAAIACRYEAGRYVLYQMQELVATIAAKRAGS